MQERDEKVESIFQQALDVEPEKRKAFVDRACAGDRELKAEVEELLEHDERRGAEKWGESPLFRVELGSLEPLTGDQRIGPYKLLQRIGKGGMGDVYLAEDTEELHRRVALKLIKLGMDTEEVLRRFQTEKETLARMDHTNIAKVYGAGSTQEGRPYFVMEHVSGDCLTDYCDSGRLGIRERLELFTQVCEAIQHAHQKSIVHRDIKPSNVLVKLENGRPLAKVIDFGIAKAIGGEAADTVTITQDGQIVGTPGYMSPEQASNDEDIDTRTDIYSLGVLLYELLTGSLPFGSKEKGNVDSAEILRRIREEDPLRPSSKVANLARDEAKEMASKRGSDPDCLRKVIRGDLDAIILKALEKPRDRRYETASSLAADVVRFLYHQPVEARPHSSLYRLEKFLRKHRLPLAAAAMLAMLISIIGGFALSYYVRLTDLRDLAKQSAVDGDLNGLFRSLKALDGMVFAALFLDHGLRLTANRLRDPDDSLSGIDKRVMRNEHKIALTLAASRMAESREEQGGMTGNESLLYRYVLRNIDPSTVSEELRSYALVLIARLFLENPVDTPEEIEDSKAFRDRLVAILGESTNAVDQHNRLYVLSALGCCGSVKTAQRVMDFLEHTATAHEERRVVFAALERISRRTYLCEELDDLEIGWKDWLNRAVQNCQAGEERSRLTLQRWLAFAHSRKGNTETNRNDVRTHYEDSDEVDAPTHLRRYKLSPQELQELEEGKGEILTRKAPTNPVANVLAHWDFSEGRFEHRGTARPARGILTDSRKVNDRNEGHLRLNRFGYSELVLPFEIKKLPREGIALQLRHLAASRFFLPYQGTAKISVFFDGWSIAGEDSVTFHGSTEWEPPGVSRDFLSPGKHEFSVRLNLETTTTYWIYEARIVLQ